jgi:hypothetical protein
MNFYIIIQLQFNYIYKFIKYVLINDLYYILLSCITNIIFFF